ncbi:MULTISPECIES: ABC transporter ATP-binding protein [unclassified Meiothermus]|uniref:ABC transporter ATP-binding protein n=1 Tax=unclassified Meiothermus TaxID=370471 RepID=UPI000D7BE5DB|nr:MULTISPECIES: ABC transporter ATP-binding protein [unclassified Meiothermus]PZA06451.1 ABC transporter ATP-binding protein [Meiothermus sp. Pnk-1]RYM36282.1 ABC transporter ATP-binding protein [Meiothermus sp. PNK-Is4]
MAQLAVENVTLSFGGLNALSGVSLEVSPGELVSIIGPNGAGKTSLLNCISGFYHPSRGRIEFEGHDLTHAAPHTVARYGVARAFQNIELFTGLTVLENLMLARHIYTRYGLLANLWVYGKALKVAVENRKVVEEVIDFMELEPYRKALVGDLPYGVRKRVEVARALSLSPKLLLLDEPMAGMTLEEKEDMVRFILDIRAERGTTVILIEHDLGVVMDISDRVYVLDFGQVIAAGTPGEVARNPRVQEAYVGVEHA